MENLLLSCLNDSNCISKSLSSSLFTSNMSKHCISRKKASIVIFSKISFFGNVVCGQLYIQWQVIFVFQHLEVLNKTVLPPYRNWICHFILFWKFFHNVWWLKWYCLLIHDPYCLRFGIKVEASSAKHGETQELIK